MRAMLLLLSGITASGMGLAAPAPVAHAAESAAVTIATLEAQGFDVNVDRLGNAPLTRCLVTNVRNPKDHTRLVRRGGDVVHVVERRTVTVSLDCSG